MYAAEVCMGADDDFGALLREMRIWLDGRRFQPSTFTYSFHSPGMRIHVSFAVRDEAEAFAKRFGGSLNIGGWHVSDGAR